MKKINSVTVFWFRRDLRLHDNHGFFEALKTSDMVLPIFIFDRFILSELADKHDKRVLFIHQTIKKLNNELLKVGSSLMVINDEPINAFKTISESYTIKDVFANHDYEPYAIKRDLEISQWLKSKNMLAG